MSLIDVYSIFHNFTRMSVTQMTVFNFIYANLVILATPVRIISYQVVSLGHFGGFVAL